MEKKSYQEKHFSNLLTLKYLKSMSTSKRPAVVGTQKKNVQLRLTSSRCGGRRPRGTICLLRLRKNNNFMISMIS